MRMEHIIIIIGIVLIIDIVGIIGIISIIGIIGIIYIICIIGCIGIIVSISTSKDIYYIIIQLLYGLNKNMCYFTANQLEWCDII